MKMKLELYEMKNRKIALQLKESFGEELNEDLKHFLRENGLKATPRDRETVVKKHSAFNSNIQSQESK